MTKVPRTVVPFRPPARRRIHESVAEQLRDAILDGRWQPGQKLPPGARVGGGVSGQPHVDPRSDQGARGPQAGQRPPGRRCDGAAARRRQPQYPAGADLPRRPARRGGACRGVRGDHAAASSRWRASASSARARRTSLRCARCAPRWPTKDATARSASRPAGRCWCWSPR